METTVEIAQAINFFKHRRGIVDSLMEECMMGDKICALKLKIPLETWISYCKSDGPVPEGCNMSPEMIKLDCTFDHIASLLPSIQQAQAFSKLRKLVSHFAFAEVEQN
jgi:hypothetical protein